MVTLWEKSLKICESLKQPCKRQFNVGQSKIAQEENARLERQKTSGRLRQRFSETRAEEYEEEWTYQQDTAPSHKAKETQA